MIDGITVFMIGLTTYLIAGGFVAELLRKPVVYCPLDDPMMRLATAFAVTALVAYPTIFSAYLLADALPMYLIIGTSFAIFMEWMLQATPHIVINPLLIENRAPRGFRRVLLRLQRWGV